MKRLAVALAALGLFALAHRIEPRGAAWPTLPGHPLVAALGPLRPLVAELVRLRFDSSWRGEQLFGQLDDAWTVLALRPDRAEEFAHFGCYFVIEAPRLTVDPADQRVLARAGLDILEWGRRLHPGDWRVPQAECLAVEFLLRADPQRADAAALRARLLDRCDELIAHAPAPDDPHRGNVRVDVAMRLEWMLKQVGRSAPITERAAPLAERAKNLANRLLAWPDLPDATRNALTNALR